MYISKYCKLVFLQVLQDICKVVLLYISADILDVFRHVTLNDERVTFRVAMVTRVRPGVL